MLEENDWEFAVIVLASEDETDDKLLLTEEIDAAREDEFAATWAMIPSKLPDIDPDTTVILAARVAKD